jgi:hypothetical protein
MAARANCARLTTLLWGELIRQQRILWQQFGLAKLLRLARVRRDWPDSGQILLSPHREFARLMKFRKPVRTREWRSRRSVDSVVS